MRRSLDKEQHDEMRRELGEMNRAAYRDAVESPPVIVQAYEEVYGERPEYIRFGRF